MLRWSKKDILLYICIGLIFEKKLLAKLNFCSNVAHLHIHTMTSFHTCMQWIALYWLHIFLSVVILLCIVLTLSPNLSWISTLSFTWRLSHSPWWLLHYRDFALRFILLIVEFLIVCFSFNNCWVNWTVRCISHT